MPWDNNNGGPWGKPKGNKPSNIEDLFKKGHDHFNNFFPFKGSHSLVVMLVLIAGFIMWVSSGIYLVKEGEQGSEILFGKFSSNTTAGLHFWWPTPIGGVIVTKVSQINRVDSGVRAKTNGQSLTDDSETLMLTGDENIVSVGFTVLWYIKKVEDYLFNDPDPHKTVRLAAESALREIIGQSPIVFILTKGRGEVADKAQKLLQNMLDMYHLGIQIQEVRLQSVDPPAQVIDAFRDVQRSRADMESSINESWSYSNSIIPEAIGMSAEIKKKAEGYREAVVAAAKGETARFLSVLRQYKAAPEVTKQRIYIDMMKQVLKGKTKVLMDSKGSGVVPYLPLPQLKTVVPNKNKGEQADRENQASRLIKEVK